MHKKHRLLFCRAVILYGLRLSSNDLPGCFSILKAIYTCEEARKESSQVRKKYWIQRVSEPCPQIELEHSDKYTEHISDSYERAIED